MNQLTMIENQKQFNCAYQHNQPILTVVLDPKLPNNQRLLCNQCLEFNETTAKTMEFQNIIQIIEDEYKKKLNNIEDTIKINVKQIESLLSTINQLKQNINQQLDQLINIVNNWIQNIQIIESSLNKYKYSFFEELDKLIKDPKNLQMNPIINNILQINQSQKSQFNSKLQQFKDFAEFSKCIQILSNIQMDQISNIEEFQTENLLKSNDQLKVSSLNYTNNLYNQMYLNLTFSFYYKHNDILISNNGKIVDNGDGVWGYCMCEQVIPKTGKILFAFEILRIDHWCEVGIGFREMIKQHGYRGEGQGKGSYLLRETSTTYFHHSNNTQGKAINFQVNDIVIIEVSIEQKYIKWSKQNSQDYLITEIDISQDLYPCVYTSNSTVRIKDIS
ncbi:unnamed protein product [Paramecium sonneborni]|uniref:Uncharacterized protein n=1 Tax=Paramecium sonneborni TaxID=65129 RepID=A0A8S1RQD1_9CILI|nr:unnamed protein product [Paramecium sonneborni]